MCCDVVEAVGAVLHACGVLVCCRDRTNGARGAPNRSVMRDLERSWPGCFQFLITKSVPAGPAHRREGCQSGTQMDAHGAQEASKWNSDQGPESAVEGQRDTSFQIATWGLHHVAALPRAPPHIILNKNRTLRVPVHVAACPEGGTPAFI